MSHACGVLLSRVAILERAADARTLAAERYLDGRELLFPDLVAAWDAQEQRTREHTAMTLRLAELDGVDVTLPDDDEEAAAGIGSLLADLVEPAKATALEKLGESERGLEIARGWLRAKLDAPGAEATHISGPGPTL